MTFQLTILLLFFMACVTILGVVFLGFRYLERTEEMPLIAKYTEEDE